MKKMSRREVFAVIPALVTVRAAASGAPPEQSHTSEFPASKSAAPAGETTQVTDKPVRPEAAVPNDPLAVARVFAYDRMPLRTMANGGESRGIAHGVLATGETVNLHQSTQPAGAASNPPHAIQHTEFILVREGELEFQHESGGQMQAERVGPGGVIYVAFGTKHALRNVGDGTARYFVVGIGGDAK